MSIKVHYNQNTLTGLKLSNITIFNPPKNKFEKVGKLRIIYPRAVFQLHTYDLVVNALTHCTTLLENNFGKENIYKIKLDFIVHFDRMYITSWRYPTLPLIIYLKFKVV